MRSRSTQLQTRPRRGLSCLQWMVALIWLVVALVTVYLFWLRPSLSRTIGEQAALRLDTGDSVVEAVLPTLIDALPAGEVRITEQEANTYLQAHADLLAPIERANLRFVADGLEVDVRAFGLDGKARMGLALQNGRVIAIDPRLDGPLGRLVVLDELLAPLEQQLNDRLEAQGRRIADLRIIPGELIVTLINT
ncbi:MAG: hypothetical protein ACUVSY_01315 [Roseiflexus sp.]